MAFVKELLLSESRTRIEEWVRSRTLATPMPNGDTLCRVLGHYPFVVSLADHSVAPHLVLDGYWEMWVTMCLARRVKPGWHCIDVGANFGYFTVLLAELVGREGRVEAWEPSADVWQRLTQTLGLTGMRDRILLCSVAAGLAEGSMPRFLVKPDGENWGSARVMRGYTAGSQASQQGVKERRLDAFTKLGRIDFVKIDAEGMEPEVWASLGEHRPTAALIEWEPTRYAEPAAFLALVRGQGYALGIVTQHGDVEPCADDERLLGAGQMLWLDKRA